MRFAGKGLADVMVPQYLAVRPEPLPRNAGGRIGKPLLRDETPLGAPLRRARAPAAPLEPVSTVETVRGPVDTAELGQTLMHEQVFALSTEHLQNYGADDWWDEDERVTDAVEKLNTPPRAWASTPSPERGWKAAFRTYVVEAKGRTPGVERNLLASAG